jgi:hypothetical protein
MAIPIPVTTTPRNFSPAALTTRDAALYVGMSAAFMRAARGGRASTSGPPYVQCGRSIRYLVKDLDSWLAARRIGK